MKFGLIGLPAGDATLSHDGAVRTATIAQTATSVEALSLVSSAETVNRVRPTGVNVSAFGHTLTSLSFRPKIYADRLQAEGGSATRIEANWNAVSRYGVLRSGALDGADAAIYRVRNGALTLARMAKITRHVSNSPSPLCGRDKMVAVSAPPEMRTQLYRYHRKNSPNHVWVRSVGADGRRSAAISDIHILSGFSGSANSNIPLSATVDRPAGGDLNPDLPAPRAITVSRVAGSELVVGWTRPADETGIVGYEVFMNDEGPDAVEGAWFELEDDGGAPVEAGDLVTLRKRFDTVIRFEEVFRNYRGGADSNTGDFVLQNAPNIGYSRSWPGDPGLPDYTLTPGPGGEKASWAMRLTLAPGERFRYQVGRYAGLKHSGYRTLLPETDYRVRIQMRASAGAATFQLTNNRDDAAPVVNVPLQTEWPVEDVEFLTGITAAQPRADKLVSFGILELTAPADAPAVFEIGYVRVSEADRAFGELDPDVAARIGTSCGYVRAHNFIKTSNEGIDLATMLADPSALKMRYNRNGDSLHQTLTACAAAAPSVWLQIDPQFLPEDWMGLVEYLAAPAGAGRWANRRVELGQSAPWTDIFDRIIFEIGNETWNFMGDFKPWSFSGITMPDGARSVSGMALHALYSQWAWRQMAQSPWWPTLKAKLETAVSGQSSIPSVSGGLIAPGLDHVTIAPYLGGWESGASAGDPDSPQTFYDYLALTERQTRPDMAVLKAIAGQDGPSIGTYEYGPGYALPSGSQTDAERRREDLVGKSQAAGVTTFDGMCEMAALGADLQSFFLSGDESMRWGTHKKPDAGGWAFPQWLAVELFNTCMTGDFLKVAEVSQPTAPLEGGSAQHRPSIPDAPLVKVYAARDGARLSVACVSRRVPGAGPDIGGDGFTPMRLHLPVANAASATLRRMWAPFNAHNMDSQAVTIETLPVDLPSDPRVFDISAAVGADDRGLPPCSVFVWIFEGL